MACETRLDLRLRWHIKCKRGEPLHRKVVICFARYLVLVVANRCKTAGGGIDYLPVQRWGTMASVRPFLSSKSMKEKVTGTCKHAVNDEQTTC